MQKWYFQVFNKGSIISNLCHYEIEVNQNFYLDNNANIFHNNLIHQKAFRECYSHCLTCKEGGNEINNNCSTCDKGFETYPFSKQQCLINKTNCTNINKYWTFINNNISCIDFNNCNEFIIIGGSNNGQCVSNCQNFNNPYEETVFLTLNVTGNCKYCISFDECLKNKFEIDPYSKTCESHLNCEDIDMFSDEQFIIRNETEIINTTNEIDLGNKGYIKYEILTKIVLKENENYSKFHIRDKTLLDNYVKLHQANLKNDTRIYLIYTEKYKNFTINIYPLDIEDFVYDNILNPKNLGFINFTDGFSFLNEYKDTNDTYILVILLESNNTNSSINELSYYFYKYNEA